MIRIYELKYFNDIQRLLKARAHSFGGFQSIDVHQKETSRRYQKEEIDIK